MPKQNTSQSSSPACPCGSAQTYPQCCGRFHSGPQYLQAPDAVTLMRSRYSAFVLDQLDYLYNTWHSSTRPAQLEPNSPGTRWLGLEVRNHTQTDPTHATVEFVARVRYNGKASRLHEISRFVREEGRWYYLDGLFPRDAG
jgi:SEC-C motif-containing protein